MTEIPKDVGQLEISVVKRVLTSFVDAVAEESALKEVAARLRKTALDDGHLSEQSLRLAMFGDAEG